MEDLLPFTFARPVWDLRFGIFTQRERWSRLFPDQRIYCQASGRLQAVFSDLPAQDQEVFIVNSGIIPDTHFLTLLKEMGPNEYALSDQGDWLAAVIHSSGLHQQTEPIAPSTLNNLGLAPVKSGLSPMTIRYPEDLFRQNGNMIIRDFPLATAGQLSKPLRDPHTKVYGKDNLYISPGVSIRAAIINAEDGPVYLGPHSTISEGAIIARPHALGSNATVSMGAKLRGDTTVGPWSKVGGEVSNSIIMGYSSKGHEGYLGNSVIGYWCNLGADSNNSNLKNNYANVKLWHYPSGRFRNTGLQFCGLMMADHSKCGINTMFNTGTVVGVSANIFGSGFPRNFIPSFSWGGASGFQTYQLRKAMEVANMVMQRRGITLSDEEKALMSSIFEETAAFRRF